MESETSKISTELALIIASDTHLGFLWDQPSLLLVDFKYARDNKSKFGAIIRIRTTQVCRRNTHGHEENTQRARNPRVQSGTANPPLQTVSYTPTAEISTISKLQSCKAHAGHVPSGYSIIVL